MTTNPRPQYTKNSAGWDGNGFTFYRGAIAKEKKTELQIYDFQFNPNKLDGTVSADFEMFNPAMSNLPIASFNFMGTPKMETTLFVDSTDLSQKTNHRVFGNSTGPATASTYIGVWADILTILGFMSPDVKGKTFTETGRFISPTPILFIMGPLIARTVLVSMSWSITKWHTNLVPSRAEIKLEINEITSSLKKDFSRLSNIQTNVTKLTRFTTVNSEIGYNKYIEFYGQENFFAE